MSTPDYPAQRCGHENPRTLLLPLALSLLALTAFPGTHAFGAQAKAAAANRRPASAGQPASIAGGEEELIAVLNSAQSPGEKDAACARLKRIGTARCIPALAALLSDEQLSHSARYALESMPYPDAGKALIRALGQTSGLLQAGVIQSLGFRREAQAVPELAKLLAAADPIVATAAAMALGQIGGNAALRALESAPTAQGKVHDARTDALLRCAQAMLASTDRSKALPIFQRLYRDEPSPGVRVAAFRGMILASGKVGLAPAVTGIAGPPGPSQVAALQLVRELDSPGATRTFVKLLPTLDATVQCALIGGLCQRGDPSAAPAIAALTTNAAPEVRLAALGALGVLGDASVVPLLAQSAASATSAQRDAARLALVRLQRGKITEALLSAMQSAPVPVQVELARALGERSEPAAVPGLLQLAASGSESTQTAALQALGRLADQPHLAAMVRLVVDARTAAARAQAAEALNSVCQRIQSKHGRVETGPLTDALASGSPDARVALLPVCSGLSSPEIRAALRQAVKDPAPAVRAAGIRAMCDTRDAELLPDLQRVVTEASEENFRTLAVAAAVRLTTQEESARLTNAQRLEVLGALLTLTLNADQKRLVLAGLGDVPELPSLDLAAAHLDDAGVQNEAVQAVIKIAAALANTQPQQASAALQKARAGATDSATRQAADAALRQIEANADFIMVWQASGPYVQEGKDYAALFDIAFAPESGDSSAKWLDLPPGSDAKRPYVMDLLKAFGGEQRVAYARAFIHSDAAQAARLEIGSDDGFKVWLNHELVHANNTFRALQPGSDKMNVNLEPGWNELLLKVTQLNQGWGFCARLVKPDGAHLDGLRFAPAPSKEAGR